MRSRHRDESRSSRITLNFDGHSVVDRKSQVMHRLLQLTPGIGEIPPFENMVPLFLPERKAQVRLMTESPSRWWSAKPSAKAQGERVCDPDLDPRWS